MVKELGQRQESVGESNVVRLTDVWRRKGSCNKESCVKHKRFKVVLVKRFVSGSRLAELIRRHGSAWTHAESWTRGVCD
jgi:hypothetical protein